MTPQSIGNNSRRLTGNPLPAAARKARYRMEDPFHPAAGFLSPFRKR